MRIKWIAALAVVLSFFMISSQGQVPKLKGKTTNYLAKLITMPSPKHCKIPGISSLSKIKAMLNSPSVGMSPSVITKVMATLTCAKNRHTRHNHILTVIDYALPSNQKRLWVFDLRKNQMLYHTYVSHGITSGALLTNQFSNRNNSKASSLGIYSTNEAYYGRHGLSLRLQGLEPGFNDNAQRRAIVMHSAWYVNEHFIQKYGRPGRSWGCPAIPKALKKPIINTIKNNALLIVYYPGEDWFMHSKYLNCQGLSLNPGTELVKTSLRKPEKERTDIVFIERKKDSRYEESEPIAVMSADHYFETFHHNIPLTRMLRCQINQMEYVALSDQEFETLASTSDEDAFKDIIFVIPEVKKVRGYYKTEMKVVQRGKIKGVSISPGDYTVTFDKSPPAHLKTTHRFIRWLGL